ncbi:MAG: transposase [Candidatus Edwardsbacteria bacterium]
MYFVTICTHQRECLLGEIENGQMFLNQYGKVVNDEWLRTAKVRSNVLLDTFVVMPNHLHGIIIITDVVGATRRVAPTGLPNGPKSGSVGAMIGQFKSIVSKRINRVYDTSCAVLWQRNYYEHIIRNEKSLNKIRQYIIENPLYWDLDEENPINVKTKF